MNDELVKDHEKRESRLAGHTARRLSWISHGKQASVEFWIQVYGDPPPVSCGDSFYDGKRCFAGGFEIHSRVPPSRSHDKPDHENCTVVGGLCWHDGSGLSASQFFETWDQRDETAFAEVDIWLRRHVADYAVDGP